MSESVQVCVRFRPANDREGAQGGGDKVVAEFSGDEVKFQSEGHAQPRRFTYDSAFQPSVGQEEVFDSIGRPTVDNILKGYNATVLAYGQTGSGKTHSMMGPGGGDPACLEPSHERYGERGLMPRIAEELFAALGKLDTKEVEWSVTVQCFELYKEAIRDLNCAPSEQKEYRIREDTLGGRGVYVENIVEKPCGAANDLLRLVRDANRQRHTAATGANDTSSRSHLVTVVTVQQANHVLESRTRAHLHLVDLAGSEKVGKTGAQGERLKEAQMINLSLTLLGNVIFKLTDGKSLHIPYRDSKLTRILQDSFGGNSRTTLLCNCSPHVYNSAETLSTLQFASRAKLIRNKPVCGKELSGDELRLAYMRALEEIRELKDQLAVASGGSRIRDQRAPGASCGHEEELDDLRKKVADAQDERNDARTDLYQARSVSESQAKELEWYRQQVAQFEQSDKDLKEKLRKEQQCSAQWARRWHDRTNKELLETAVAKQAAKQPAPGPQRTNSKRGSLAGHAGKAMRKTSAKDLKVVAAAQLPADGSEPPPTGTPDASEKAPGESTSTPPSELAPLPPDPALLEKIDGLETELDSVRRRCGAAERLYSEIQRSKAQAGIELEHRADRIDALERQLQLQDTKLKNTESDCRDAVAAKERLEATIQDAALSHEEKERLLGRAIQDKDNELLRLREEHGELGRLAMRLRDAAAQREYCELVAIEMAVKAEDIAAAENDMQMLEAWTVEPDVKAAIAGSALRTLGAVQKHFDMIYRTLDKEPFTAMETEAQRLTILRELGFVLERINFNVARVNSLRE
eukprot:Hpha_TRINITY_DN14925_c0_g9::TRINITY_DN14925_c0_g9_i1::g.145004::m.145004/K10396/KIF5; kinesin family member 5